MHRPPRDLSESQKNPGPHAAVSAVLLLLFTLLPHVCATAQTSKPLGRNPDIAPVYGYAVVKTRPHDALAFTQGLAFKDNTLYESTGRKGFSSLRVVDLNNGGILKKVDLQFRYFGEGITVLKGKVFQLTWLDHKGFIYEQGALKPLGEFNYEGKGWGLTDDGRSLIMSDGTNALRFLDPQTFQTQRVITVYDNGTPLGNLNELEYIKGEIYANIWHSEKIVRIDPDSGKILGWVDLTGLRPAEARHNKEAVLNGIAYDEPGGRIFVTGKLWPVLFEIMIVKK